jgi:hypothetical protein
MWGGEPKIKDPETAVAAAAVDGGDEACRGTPPSTPRQSAVEKGEMSPHEPDIDVRVVAKIYHILNDEYDDYERTRIELEGIATVRINNEKVRIVHFSYTEKEIWEMNVDDIKQIADEVESLAANDAFKFLTKRRELLDALKAAGVEVILEKVVEGDYFDDDP